MKKMIREIIYDGIRNVLSENREVEEIVLGGEAYQELERELLSTCPAGMTIRDFSDFLPHAIRNFLPYPIKIISYLPSDYIALRIKNEI